MLCLTGSSLETNSIMFFVLQSPIIVDVCEPGFKPGLHIVGRIVSMCLRPCPKEHITAPQVSIAKNLL